MTTGTIVSVRIGRSRDVARPEWDRHGQRTWRSAYGKDEVPGPVKIGTLGPEGDEHEDTSVHGGPEMAVLAYAAEHYARWRELPGLEAMGPGGFGENLTVDGLDERSVCIGDVYEAGSVRFQVSSPRGPCMNISRWWNEPRLMTLASESLRIGWYLRVLGEGTLARGDAMRLVERPQPDLSVARVFQLRLGLENDAAVVRRLLTLPELSPRWRSHFEKVLARS